ncbi:MAG: hypothetical protein V5A47_12165 [Bacteroidales bacterium]
MPTPSKKVIEEGRKEEWIYSVCVPYLKNREGVKEKVAVARCYSIWEQEEKKIKNK